MTSKNYCRSTLAMTVLGLVGVACFNGSVDPYGQYGTGWLPMVVQASRTQKLDLMEQVEEAPPGLILGSSRVLKFEPAYLQAKTGLRFFNAGVNHGRPTDYLAIVRWYQQRWKCYPKMVILGVDSAALHPVAPLDARIASERRLAKVVPECISWKDSLSRYSELVGFKQVRSSLASLVSAARSRSVDEPIESYTDDGLIIYRQRESQIRDGVYDFKAALQYNEKEFEGLYRTFSEVSAAECVRLVEVVKLLRRNETQVYLFATPFHPEMLPCLTSHQNFQLREAETRTLLGLLAIHCGAHVADFCDLESIDGDASQFVDGIHPLEANTRLMIDRLLESRGANQYALQ